MKRNTTKVSKRTFTLKNALPAFVSIVNRGANFIPLNKLVYAEGSDKFSEVEINRIVFSKDAFTADAVKTYLDENDYIDYSIEETETTYVVPGISDEQFSDISEIEYADGVKFFIGKLVEASPEAQQTTEVVEAEIMAFNENQEENAEEVIAQHEDQNEGETPDATDEGESVQANEAPESATETDADANEVEAEIVAEADPEVAQEVEIVEESASEADTEVATYNIPLFQAKAEEALAIFMDSLVKANEEARTTPQVELFTAEEVEQRVAEAVESALQALNDKESESFNENAIDETPIVVQNSKVVLSEEPSDEPNPKEPESHKFSERKSKDLFGL